MPEDKVDLIDLICKAIRIAMPDLRHYYRMPKKGKVTGVYASDGKYYADVKPLRNDDSEDANEPVASKVEIPIMWGGPDRGVVCPPTVGTLCDITYYDGDPNYPRISNFRWQGQNAPKAELNEFVIQLEPGVEIRIDKEKRMITLTPEHVNTEAGKNWTISAGDNAEITAGKDASVTAGNTVTVTAPQINLVGNVASHSTGQSISQTHERTHRKHEGSYSLEGPMAVQGAVNIQGDITVSGTVTASAFAGKVQGCSGCG